MVTVVEILIKLLENGLTAFSTVYTPMSSKLLSQKMADTREWTDRLHTRMSSKLLFQKMADTSKDELLLGRGIHTSQYDAHSKQVSACVSNIV